MNKNNILKIVIFIVVLLIPIIYSFFYLKSYWDPYADLTGIKIAVVNLDKGENGKNQGEEFLNELKKDGTFDICNVDSNKADEGMKNGDYYAKITIPSDFTNCLNSVSTKDKKTPTITYSPNQASNYLSSQIINSAIKTIENNLQSKINSEIAKNLADKLNEVPASLFRISDGANTILNGSKELNSGLEQISTGTKKLNENYTKFNDGVASAYDGSKKVTNGIEQSSSGVKLLANGATSLNNAVSLINSGLDSISAGGASKITELASGINTLSSSTADLNSGITSYVDNVNVLSEKTSSYVQNTNSVITNVNEYIGLVENSNTELASLISELSNLNASDTTQVQEVINKAKSISNNGKIDSITSKANNIKSGEAYLAATPELLYRSNNMKTPGDILKAGVTKLDIGTKKLADGSKSFTSVLSAVTTLQDAMQKVSLGTNSLKSGIDSLNTGVDTLKTGSASLTEGLETLNNSSSLVKDGISSLESGADSAYNGSAKLVSGIEEFNNEIKKGIDDTNKELENLNGIEEFAKDPVEFKTEAYGEVKSYGIAFTPLFLCIGLWVGALMSYVVLYYDQKHRFGVLDSNNSNKLAQNIMYILIGAIQGIVVGGLLKIGLHFDVQNICLYYFASTLIGITFMSIIQFLIKNLGDVGKFIALIVLVLQLAASGGTFPVETINKGFQLVTPFLPMTYSIKLLREILVPTLTNFKANYVLILVLITVLCVGITYLVDIMKNKKQAKENV